MQISAFETEMSAFNNRYLYLDADISIEIQISLFKMQIFLF